MIYLRLEKPELRADGIRASQRAGGIAGTPGAAHTLTMPLMYPCRSAKSTARSLAGPFLCFTWARNTEPAPFLCPRMTRPMAPCGDTGTAQRYRDTRSDTPALRHPRPAPSRGRPGADGGGSRSASGPRPKHSYLAPASPGKKEALTSRTRRGPSGAVTSRGKWRSFRFRRLLPGTPGEPREGRARGEAQRGAGEPVWAKGSAQRSGQEGRVCKGLGRDRGMRGSALTE